MHYPVFGATITDLFLSTPNRLYMKKLPLLFCTTLFLFISCSIEKRLYRNGFYCDGAIHNHHGERSKNTPPIPALQSNSAFPPNTEEVNIRTAPADSFATPSARQITCDQNRQRRAISRYLRSTNTKTALPYPVDTLKQKHKGIFAVRSSDHSRSREWKLTGLVSLSAALLFFGVSLLFPFAFDFFFLLMAGLLLAALVAFAVAFILRKRERSENEHSEHTKREHDESPDVSEKHTERLVSRGKNFFWIFVSLLFLVVAGLALLFITEAGFVMMLIAAILYTPAFIVTLITNRKSFETNDPVAAKGFRRRRRLSLFLFFLPIIAVVIALLLLIAAWGG